MAVVGFDREVLPAFYHGTNNVMAAQRCDVAEARPQYFSRVIPHTRSREGSCNVLKAYNMSTEDSLDTSSTNHV